MRKWLSLLKTLNIAPGVLALVYLVAMFVPAHAAQSPLVSAVPDVRLLFEVSNAASTADPEQVRGEAASLLVKLLPDDGRGGVWVYGDHVSRLVDHGRTDIFWKRLAIVHTRSLESQGDTVDLGAALAAAAWDADEDTRLQRHIIVVGSGRFSSGDTAADVSRRDQLLNTTASQFAAAGIHVHAVVLPGASDSGVLRPLAERTGGLYLKVRSITDLHKAFENLLNRTAAPPLLRVREGAFMVEPGLGEMTLWRSGDEPDLELIDPSGILHTRTLPGANVHWHDARGYDVVTIVEPEAGRWQFKGESSARVYAFGELALRVAEVPATLFPGYFNQVDFMLFAGAEAITDESFLGMTRADARLVGEAGSLPLFVERLPAGIFRIRLTDAISGGNWTLEVGLDGPTFSREVSIPFVLANPVEVSVLQDGKDLVAFAKFANASVDPRSLQATVQVRVDSGARQSFPGTPFPGGLWQIVVPDTVLQDSGSDVEIAFSFFGRYQNQSPFELHTEALKVVAPLAAEQTFRFDAKGRALEIKAATPGGVDPRASVPSSSVSGAESGAADAHNTPANELAVARSADVPQESELPIWFVAAASVLNLLVAVGLGWFLSRPRIPLELQAWIDENTPQPA